MSDSNDRRIKAALYTAVLNKLTGELSELEAKEVLLTNAPTYITSKDFDHADHIEELREALIQCKRELWYCAQQAGFDWKIDGERRAKHPVSKAYDLATQILAAPD